MIRFSDSFPRLCISTNKPRVGRRKSYSRKLGLRSERVTSPVTSPGTHAAGGSPGLTVLSAPYLHGGTSHERRRICDLSPVLCSPMQNPYVTTDKTVSAHRGRAESPVRRRLALSRSPEIGPACLLRWITCFGILTRRQSSRGLPRYPKLSKTVHVCDALRVANGAFRVIGVRKTGGSYALGNSVHA